MRVLVADEDATSREGAAQVLASAGHAVVTADSGCSAWRLSRRERFDLAFVSLSLPDLDGLALYSLWLQDRAVGPRAAVMLADPAGAAQMRLWSQLGGLAESPEILTRPFAVDLLADVALAAVAESPSHR